MADRNIQIGSFDTGITRQREKGGASPQALYDLVNAYIDEAGAAQSRYGTSVEDTLPAGTVGLCVFNGRKHVFALAGFDPGDPNVVVDVLIHPDPAFAGTLERIYFAKPFLGFLYVVAGFSDGTVRHYWQQERDAWLPNHVYKSTDAVRPNSADTGYTYKPIATNAPAAWQPDTTYNVGDVVQPTTENGYKYVVTEVSGDAPTSGSNEPMWTASDGALVYDDDTVNDTPGTVTTPSTGSPGGTKYDNRTGRDQPLSAIERIRGDV